MKRILLSSMLVVGIISLTVGATRAVFSATDVLAGNTVSTAHVEIDAKGESNASTLAKPFNETNLLPGVWTQWRRAAIENKSTVPVRLYMYVNTLTGTCDKTVLKVTTGHAGGDERARVVYNGWLTDLDGAGHRIELTGNPPFTSIPAGWSQVIQQQAQLHDSADDNYQNTTCTWTEVFVAETL